MSYLIDTDCISELMKPKPHPNVLNWFSDHEELSMYLSVITFGELRKEIEKLPASAKRSKLYHWVNEDLAHRFEERIIIVSIAEVNTWGQLLAKAEKAGTPLPAIDALIAASALVHGLSVVTRNTKDMETTGVDLINPWEYKSVS